MVESLLGKILVAAPTVVAPESYVRAVVLLVGHIAVRDELVGLALNKPTASTYASFHTGANKVPFPTELRSFALNTGGPDLQQETFLLHSPPYQTPRTTTIAEDLRLTPMSNKVRNDLLEWKLRGPVFVASGCFLFRKEDLIYNFANDLWGVLPYNRALVFSAERQGLWQKGCDLISQSRDPDRPFVGIGLRERTFSLPLQ